MVFCWVFSRIRHLKFWDPEGDHNFDHHPYLSFVRLISFKQSTFATASAEVHEPYIPGTAMLGGS